MGNERRNHTGSRYQDVQRQYHKKKKRRWFVPFFIVLVICCVVAVGLLLAMRSMYSDDTDFFQMLLGRTPLAEGSSASSGVGVGVDPDEGMLFSVNESVDVEADTESDGTPATSKTAFDFNKLDKNYTLFDKSKSFAAQFAPMEQLNKVSVDADMLSVYSQPYDDALPIVKMAFKTGLNTYETSLVYSDSTRSFYDEKEEEGVLTETRVTNVENFAMGAYQVYWFMAEYVETSLKFQHVAYYFYVALPDSDTTLKMEVSAVSGIGKTNSLTKDLAFECLHSLQLYARSA